MTIESILTEFSRRGIALRAESDKLIAKPLNAVPPELREAVREHKNALLAHLRANPVECHAAWVRSVTPDSRHPLISPEVRQKIEAIEAEARAKGWPPELLWNAGFWDCPRGLAAVIDANDEIVEVTTDAITILKYRRHLLPFPRRIG